MFKQFQCFRYCFKNIFFFLQFRVTEVTFRGSMCHRDYILANSGTIHLINYLAFVKLKTKDNQFNNKNNPERT